MTTPAPPVPPPWPTDVYLWLIAEWLYGQFAQLNKRMDQLMAQVAVEQTDLDNLAAALETVKTNLATEIQNLQNVAPPLPAGSLDGLNQALTDLQSLQPPAATPAPADGTTPPPDVSAAPTA